MSKHIGFRIFLVLTFTAFTLAIAGCGNRIDEVINILADNGYQVGPQTDEKLAYIGAPRATGVDVNGSHILIYQVSEITDMEEVIDAVDTILEKGTGFWPTVEETFGLLTSKGFVVERILEPYPYELRAMGEAEKRSIPYWGKSWEVEYERFSRVPFTIIYVARKPT